MDKCGICDKPAVQLFETSNDGVYACFKCQPFVPEVTIEDSATDPPDPSESQNSNTDEESNDKSLYCGICHKSFQKTLQLQNHMRNHRAERRFVCTYCNKAFSQSNNLRAHLRIHTNERPFKCNECGKAFTQVTNLNNHVRLHTGERPFVCPEPGCNKAYAQQTPKRRRDRNFTPEEKELLIRLVKKHPIVKQAKLVNGKSVALKRAAWNAISEEFNRHNRSHKRDASTLKRAMDNMKSLERRKKGNSNETSDDCGPSALSTQPSDITIKPQTVAFKIEVVSDDDESGLDTTSNTVEETHDNMKDMDSNNSLDNSVDAFNIPLKNTSDPLEDNNEDNTMEQADCTQQGKGFFRAPNFGIPKSSSTTEYISRETYLKLKFLHSKQKAEMQLFKAQLDNEERKRRVLEIQERTNQILLKKAQLELEEVEKRCGTNPRTHNSHTPFMPNCPPMNNVPTFDPQYPYNLLN